MKDRILSALFASALFVAVLVAAGGTVELAHARGFVKEAFLMTAARAYFGSLYWYGFMGLLSLPLFMGAGALIALALDRLPPASKNLSAMAVVPILTGLKVVLDGWLFHPLWETRGLFLSFVSADALAFAWLWFEAL